MLLYAIAKIFYDNNPDTIKLLLKSIKTSREFDYKITSAELLT